MGKVLSEQTIEDYQKQGYYFPLEALASEEVQEIRSKLESFENEQGAPLQGEQRSKSHLLFHWVDDLMRHSKILDAVEDLLGPNILCWNSIFWIKEPGSHSFVSWHQDVRYWGLNTAELVTVWLALSPANARSGGMRVLPGSHLTDVMPHQDEYHEHNMLTRGQSISIDIDESKAVIMALEPGQISLHNVQLAHASGPNLSIDRRIGISFHYIPPSTQQTIGTWDSAALVRGRDDFGHFAIAPRPWTDFEPEAVRFHEKATSALRDILFKNAEKIRSTL